MHALEHRIPPPIVALLIVLAMWQLSQRLGGAWTLPLGVRIGLGGGVALLGIVVALAGVIEFRRARTTVNPLKPSSSSSLVTGGIYRFTRNPMYLGMALGLVGAAIGLASPWALFGPVAFVAFIARFQIAPEERAMSRLFGPDFDAYRSRTRRWL